MLYYKRKYPHAIFGSHIKLIGFPIFQFHSKSHIYIGNNVVFLSSVHANMVGLNRRCSVAVSEGAHIQIGDNCGFSGVAIYCSTHIQIGNNLTCGGNVSIWDTDFHPINFEYRKNHIVKYVKRDPIYIGDDVFIGANSIILKGVVVGDRSVIAAGSVVTGEVPSDQMWAGNPAKLIRKLPD